MNQIEKVARPDAAIEYLTNHQQQADMDGTFVKVSRQALDEVLSFIAAMPVHTEPQWQGIESAPPSPNTRVLLAWRDWRDGKWLIEAAPYETGERVGPYSNVSRHGSATHWMPLPTPPAGGSDAE